jgi:NTF2 fold immunity protein
MNQSTPTELVEQHLKKFMSEMCSWEKKLIELHKSSDGTYLDSQINTDKTRNDLIEIYEKFLTIKERKTGRLAALDFGTPLAFNPELEKIVTTNIDSLGKKAIVETIYSTYAELKRRYTLIMTTKGWRIDKREDFSAYKDKWINVIL